MLKLRKIIYLFRLLIWRLRLRWISGGEIEKFWKTLSEHADSEDLVDTFNAAKKSANPVYRAIFEEIVRRECLKIPVTDRFQNYPDTNLNIGDTVTHYHYAMMLAKSRGQKPMIVAPNIEPCSTFLPFFFEDDEYVLMKSNVFREAEQIIGKKIHKESSPAYAHLPNFFKNQILMLIPKYLKPKERIRFFGVPYDENKDEVGLNLKKSNYAAYRYYYILRKYSDHLDPHRRYIDQVLQCPDSRNESYPGWYSAKYEALKERLGINGKYVCLHLRVEEGKQRSPRNVESPENIFPTLRWLGEKGYQTVVLGSGNEARLRWVSQLNEIEGVIPYLKSEEQNLYHDLLLVSGATAMLGCCSGPASFPHLFRVPLIFLNHVFFGNGMHLPEHRFFPKNFWRNGKRLAFREWVNEPIVYSQYNDSYNEHQIEYQDLSEDQILRAVKHFITEVETGTIASGVRTPLQKKFFDLLRPHHLYLYYTKGLPSEVFLEEDSQL